MLIGGVAVGLVLGLLAGGRLDNLANIRLRFLPLLFLGVIFRFGTELGLSYGIPFFDTFRIPLLAVAYGLLLFTLWQNRSYPGLVLAFVGIALNAVAIMANGGYMPVWDRAFEQAGLTGPIDSNLHYILSSDDPAFLLRLGFLGDIIPIPIPPVQNVASIGDIFLTAGLAFFLFATLLRRSEPVAKPDEPFATSSVTVAGTRRVYLGGSEAASGGIAIRPGTGLSAGLEEDAALEQPLLMGARGIGFAGPALTPLSADGLATDAGAIALPRPRLPERFREHPYVRLALNPSFSALWTGQVISLFGDRVNQIALAAFVYEATNSPLAVALTFFAGMVPNLILSPIAGAYVDRWDHKQVLVISDLLRAAAVLLLPVGILLNVWFAYPLVFVITTISLFFRPARQAVLPRVVPEEDLLPANSAMWVGETLADVVNYPLAGLFVVFLQSSLAVAFWLDAVTYVASAVLISTIVVPPLIRTISEETRTTVIRDLQEGWAFLRHETVLLANTLQGTAGQFALGVITVASLILAKVITPGTGDEYRATYAFMETAIGVGGLVGGFVLGAVASRARKGPMIVAAYTLFGIGAVALGIAHQVPVVLLILFGLGIANMAFVIPSQTLFQERTPGELMGRVVSFRFALVFGGMSIAMAVGGLLIDVYGPGPVIVVAGCISIVAGLAGLLVRELREA
jgi:MFS family permease